MKKRKNRIVFVAILLAISIGNFFRITSTAGSIRAVDFLSIFVIGALSGLLIGILTTSGQKQ